MTPNEPDKPDNLEEGGLFMAPCPCAPPCGKVIVGVLNPAMVPNADSDEMLFAVKLPAAELFEMARDVLAKTRGTDARLIVGAGLMAGVDETDPVALFDGAVAVFRPQAADAGTVGMGIVALRRPGGGTLATLIFAVDESAEKLAEFARGLALKTSGDQTETP